MNTTRSKFQIASYKGTRPGIPGLYNRMGRYLDQGDYSHSELIFSDGMSGSSSFMDRGVRIKYIGYTSKNCWDFHDVPPSYEAAARQWFIDHNGALYDIKGNLNAGFGGIKHTSDRWFCSEAIAESLGLRDSWRYKPNGLISVLKEL